MVQARPALLAGFVFGATMEPLIQPEEPIRIPVTDVFDLHSVPPRDVKAVVEEVPSGSAAAGVPGAADRAWPWDRSATRNGAVGACQDGIRGRFSRRAGGGGWLGRDSGYSLGNSNRRSAWR